MLLNIEKLFIDNSDFFNGSFKEAFNALVTSNGSTVTLTVTKMGGGDLTEQFSSGNSIFTGGSTIGLTTGSDTSPTDNFIYILQSNPGVLVKSTSGFPTGAEHNKIGYLLVPSAVFVQNNGVYINQNWNDFLSGSDNMGHMLHMAERERRTEAQYFSGIDGNGTDNYLSPSAGNVELITTAGIIYQMHRHTFEAFDTSSGDLVLVKNWLGDSFHDITNLYDITVDSTGATIGNNKYFNLVIWGVGNKSGEYHPMMINLPGGFYNTQSAAEEDASGYDDFTMPRGFNRESSTGFLIARITIQMKTGGGTWGVISTVDLRGQTPTTAAGGVGSIVTEFADNAFIIFDESDNTKEVAFDVGTNVTTGNTRTLAAQDKDYTIGDILSAGTVDFAGNQSFAGFQAVAMVAEKGATLPTTNLSSGYWFLHTPTGRNILYMYNGSSWIPIISLASMTVYVDNTDGTDSLDKGGAVDSGAFKTVQFAVNVIPGLVGGSVIINVNDETYTETITIQGKTFTSAYTITINGTTTTDLSTTMTGGSKGGWVSADSGTTDGTTANKLIESGQNFTTTVQVGMIVLNTTDTTYATVTAVDSDTQLSLDEDIMVSGEVYTIYENMPIVEKSGAGWTINEYEEKWIQFTSGSNNGLIRVIESNTSDTLVLVGNSLTAAPANGDTFDIFDLATEMSNFVIIGAGQRSVIFNYIDFTATTFFSYLALEAAKMNYCRTSGRVDLQRHAGLDIFVSCILKTSSNLKRSVWLYQSVYANINGCLIDSGSFVNSDGILCERNGNVDIEFSLIKNAAGWGTRLLGKSYANWSFFPTRAVIKNCGIGVFSNISWSERTSASVAFIGNTTDKTPAAASDPAYID